MRESEEYQIKKSMTDDKLISIIQKICSCLNKKITIVDVGAQLSEEKHAYQALFKWDIPYQIIGFEPLEQRCRERVEKEQNTKITLLPMFVGDGRNYTFYINNLDATSSLYPLNTELKNKFCALASLKTIATQTEVKTERLDNILHDYKTIDFLKLDIQGFELNVLQSAEETLKRTNVIHCEVEFDEIYKGQPLFSEVELYLRSKDFYLVDLIISHRYSYVRKSNKYYSNDRLLWADAIFFKKIKLDNDDNIAHNLLVQALLALVVYKKDSLSEHLLSQYDPIFGQKITDLF